VNGQITIGSDTQFNNLRPFLKEQYLFRVENPFDIEIEHMGT